MTDKTLRMLYIGLNSKLKQGQVYALTIEFHGDLSEGLNGFYKSRYTTSTGEERIIATTQFEPTDASAAFPCFDEPAFKATFTMSMVRDKDHISLFNMPLKSSTSYGSNGLILDKFNTTLKMSTYLVAFIVCDFEYKQKISGSGTRVRVYSQSEQVEDTPFALDAAAKIIDHYEDFFQVAYPLPKQDLVAIPDFSAGAMENWGLITYRETAILYKDGVSSDKDMQWVGVVTAHELAHQWFGNLVTMEWWNDLWLNEGFASYVEYIGTNFIKPEWKMLDQFLYQTFQRALVLDSLSNSHPISVPVSNPAQINEIFDNISYDKGASIIRMLANYLTDGIFKSGLTFYLKNNSYGNANMDDLWQALTQADAGHGDTNVKAMMDTWTLQMGYPVVTLTKDGNKVTATQQRFLIHPNGKASTSEFKSPFDYQWKIPFTYIQSDGKNDSMLIDSHSVDITLTGSPTWIKGNTRCTGFYRVNYDTANWNALIQQLGTDHSAFSSADRTSLVDDIFHLARAGHVAQTKALDLSLYLKKERNYVPLATTISNLGYIGEVFIGRDGYKLYKQYILQQLSDIIDEVGWNDTGTHLEKLRRGIVLGEANSCGHEASVNNSRTIFYEWMTKGTQVSPNLKYVIYCNGVRYGGEEEFQFVWKKYQDETVASEKRKLMAAAACTSDAGRLKRLLEWSTDESKVRSQDTESLISYVASNPNNGRHLAWDFLLENWDMLKKRYAADINMIGKMISKIVSGFSTQEELNMVTTFFTTHSTKGFGTRRIDQSIEKLHTNVDWMNTNEATVTKWFKDNVNPDKVPKMID
ncbi:glutamyl aminopeptidase-like [Ptychodera flava]|uniref:glutamyl aminopeptidase-like n=1 Tax=Ptychodera flava TaxID=63121 RepID=UPI00396A3939